MLRIKPAWEYVAAIEGNKSDAAKVLTERATTFINDVITPQIEDMIDHPEKWTCSGRCSFEVPYHPAEVFVAEVFKLLTPLGYEVIQSHDGGGMHATIVIRWELSKPEIHKLTHR